MASLATVPFSSLPGSGTVPVVAFNEVTGELLLLPNGTPVSAIVAPGAPASQALNQSLVWSGDWLAADMGDGPHWMDASRLGVTVPVLLASFPPGTTVGAFGLAHVGFASGGTAEVTISSTAQTVSPLQGFSISTSGSGIQVSFGTQPGFVYQLQSNPSLTGDWSDAGPAVNGDGSMKLIPLSAPAPDTSMFYRLAIQP